MNAHKSLWCALVSIALVLALVSQADARGKILVDHLFASAGEFVTVEDLTTSVAEVSTVKTDQLVSNSYNEFIINTPQLSVDGSYFVATSEDLELVSSDSSVSFQAGNRFISASNLQTVAASGDILVNAPEAETQTTSGATLIQSKTFDLTSGRGGVELSTDGGDLIVQSKATVSATAGGTMEVNSRLLTLFSTTNVFTMNAASNINMGAGNVIYDALNGLAITSPKFSAVAGDAIEITAKSIAVSPTSLKVSSPHGDVNLLAFNKQSISATGALTVSGGQEGILFGSYGSSGLLSIDSTGAVSVTATGDASGSGIVVSTNTMNVKANNAVTVSGEHVNIVGYKSTQFGGSTTGSTTSLNGGLVQWNSVNTVVNSVDSTYTIPKLYATADNLAIVSDGSATFTTKGFEIAGDGSIAASGGIVQIQSDFGTILAPHVQNNGGSAIALSGVNTGLRATNFNAVGGSVLVSGTTSVSVTSVLNTALLANPSFSSGVLVGAQNFKLNNPGAAATTSISVGGDLDFLIENAVSWVPKQATFKSGPGPLSLFGDSSLTFAATTANFLARSKDDMDFTSAVLFKTASPTLSFQNTASGATGVFSAYGKFQVQGTDVLFRGNAGLSIIANPTVNNGDTVSFVGGAGVVSTTGAASWNTLREDIAITAAQSTVTATSDISILTANGGSAYWNARKSGISLVAAAGLGVRSTDFASVSGGFTSVNAQGGNTNIAVDDRGFTIVAGNDMLVTGASVSVSADYDLIGNFGSNVAIKATTGAISLATSNVAYLASTSGPVSIGARTDMTFDSGQNVRISSGGNTNDLVSFQSAGLTSVSATTAFGATVVRDTLSVQAGTNYVSDSAARTLFSGSTVRFSGQTTAVNSAASQTYVGGDVDILATNGGLTGSTTDSIRVQSDIGSLYGLHVTEHPEMRDHLRFATQRHTKLTATLNVLLSSYGNATFLSRRADVIDDDGDGEVRFTSVAGDIFINTAPDHTNDVELVSGGPLTVLARTNNGGAQKMSWQGSNDIFVHANRTVSIAGHLNGAFDVQSTGKGNVRLEADQSVVRISHDGDRVRFAALRAANNGGGQLVTIARNTLNTEAGEGIVINAEGAGAVRVPYAPGRSDGGELISDVDRNVGVIIRSDDMSGNVAIDSRNARLTFSAAGDFRASTPTVARLTGDSGFVSNTADVFSIEAEDGLVQVQGATGLSFKTDNQMAFEATRQLIMQTQDALSITAGNKASFTAEAGALSVTTEHFKDITGTAASVSFIGGGSGATLVSQDDIVVTSAFTTSVTGQRGVSIGTTGGPIRFTSTSDSRLTASEEIDLAAGDGFTIKSTGSTVDFLGNQDVQFTTTGGGIEFDAATTIGITGAHSVTLESGGDLTTKSAAQRTLVRGSTVFLKSVDRLAIDAADSLRIGTFTKPVLKLLGGGDANSVGFVLESLGSVLYDTEAAFTSTSATSTSMISGYDGISSTSNDDTKLISAQSVRISTPDSQLNFASGKDTTVTANNGAIVSAGSTLNVETLAVGNAITFKSSNNINVQAPYIDVHSPTTTVSTVDAEGTITATVSGENRLTAGTKMSFYAQNTKSAAGVGFSIVSDEEQTYTARGTTDPALSISSTGAASPITIATRADLGDIRVSTKALTLSSATAAGPLSVFSNAGIDISAGKADDIVSPANLLLSAKLDLTLSGLLANFEAANSLTYKVTTANQAINVQAGDEVRLLSSETALLQTTAASDIVFTALNALDFSARRDLIGTFAGKLSLTAGAKLQNQVGNRYSIEADTKLDITALSTASEYNRLFLNQVPYGIQIASDVENGNILFTAGSKIDVTATRLIELSAGYTGFESGSLHAIGSPIKLLGTDNFDITADSSANFGWADVVVKSLGGGSIATTSNTDTLITGSGLEPGSGTVSFVATKSVQFTSAVGDVDIKTGARALFDTTGALSLVATTERVQITAAGPSSASQNTAPSVRIDSDLSVTLKSAGKELLVSNDHMELDGAAVNVVGVTTTISTYSTASPNFDDGITIRSRGAGGITVKVEDISKTVKYKAVKTFSVETTNLVSYVSEPFVAGGQITFDASDLINIVSDDQLFVQTGSLSIESAGDLSLITGYNTVFSFGVVTQFTSTTDTNLIGNDLVSIDGDLVFTNTQGTFTAQEGIYISTDAAYTMGAQSLVMRAGVVKSQNPSGEIRMLAQGNIQLKSSNKLFVESGDNVLSQTSAGTSLVSTNTISLVALRSSIQLRSVTIEGTSGVPAAGDYSVTTSGQNVQIRTNSHLAHRRHQRLQFFTNDCSGAAPRQGSTTLQNVGYNSCSCSFGFCECPNEVAVANQIFWALHDYGLMY